jgi:hypothetical protein
MNLKQGRGLPVSDGCRAVTAIGFERKGRDGSIGDDVLYAPLSQRRVMWRPRLESDAVLVRF